MVIIFNTSFYLSSYKNLGVLRKYCVLVSQEYKLVRRAGHGELTSTISGLGLLEIPGGSTIQFVTEVPTTGTYEVVMRYEVCGS